MRKTIFYIINSILINSCFGQIPSHEYEAELINALNGQIDCNAIQTIALESYFQQSYSSMLKDEISKFCSSYKQKVDFNAKTSTFNYSCWELPYTLEALIMSDKYSIYKGISRVDSIITDYEVDSSGASKIEIIYSRLLRESIYSLNLDEKKSLIIKYLENNKKIFKSIIIYLINTLSPNSVDRFELLNFMADIIRYQSNSSYQVLLMGTYLYFVNQTISENTKNLALSFFESEKEKIILEYQFLGKPNKTDKKNLQIVKDVILYLKQ